VITHFHDFSKTFMTYVFSMTFPGLEMTILKCHDFSRFSTTVRTLIKSLPRTCDRHLAVATARRTLYAEHLSDLERGAADLAQRVDDSLGVGLRQERRVQQGARSCNTHTHRRRAAPRVRDPGSSSQSSTPTVTSFGFASQRLLRHLRDGADPESDCQSCGTEPTRDLEFRADVTHG